MAQSERDCLSCLPSALSRLVIRSLFLTFQFSPSLNQLFVSLFQLQLDFNSHCNYATDHALQKKPSFGETKTFNLKPKTFQLNLKRITIPQSLQSAYCTITLSLECFVVKNCFIPATKGTRATATNKKKFMMISYWVKSCGLAFVCWRRSVTRGSGGPLRVESEHAR